MLKVDLENLDEDDLKMSGDPEITIPERQGSRFERSHDLQADLPDYRIISELGRGASATVYRATQKTVGRDVAIKHLAPFHSSSANSLRSLASDPVMAQLRLDGDKNLSSLSDLQAYQYHVYYRQHWLRFQNIFFQRRFGVLEEGVWGTYARIICTDIKTEGIRANWPDHAEVLDPEFVIFVESC